MTLAVDDPVAAAVAYGRFTGTTPVPCPGGMDVPGARATMRLISPEQTALAFAGDPVLGYRRPVPIGVGFNVLDLGIARKILAESGIPFKNLATGGIRIGSADACGVAVDFI